MKHVSLPLGILTMAVLLRTGPVEAKDRISETKLTQSVLEFSLGNLNAAMAHLDEAKKLTADAETLAKVHRQRGIIFDVEAKNLNAVLAFMQAIYFDDTIELNDREHRGSVMRLFECANSLVAQGLKERTVRTRFSDTFAESPWICPAAPKEARPLSFEDTSSGSPGIEAMALDAPANASLPQLEATAIDVEGYGPTWPLWVGASVAVAAAGTGTYFGVSGRARASDGNVMTHAGGAATRANVAFAIAGTAAVFTLGYWVWNHL